jgi:N-acetylneuraminic acid mutarotase
MSAVEFRDKIYLIGGVSGVAGPFVKAVEVYDPGSDTWTQKASIPTPRTALAVGVVGSKIYAIGGAPVVQGAGLTTVEIYQPLTDTWEKGTDMPTARVFLGAGTVDNKIYAVGGVVEGLGPHILSTVEEFSLTSLSVAALNKLFTFWGNIKIEN